MIMKGVSGTMVPGGRESLHLQRGLASQTPQVVKIEQVFYICAET